MFVTLAVSGSLWHCRSRTRSRRDKNEKAQNAVCDIEYGEVDAVGWPVVLQVTACTSACVRALLSHAQPKIATPRTLNLASNRNEETDKKELERAQGRCAQQKVLGHCLGRGG